MKKCTSEYVRRSIENSRDGYIDLWYYPDSIYIAVKGLVFREVPRTYRSYGSNGYWELIPAYAIETRVNWDIEHFYESAPDNLYDRLYKVVSHDNMFHGFDCTNELKLCELSRIIGRYKIQLKNINCSMSDF